MATPATSAHAASPEESAPAVGPQAALAVVGAVAHTIFGTEGGFCVRVDCTELHLTAPGGITFPFVLLANGKIAASELDRLADLAQARDGRIKLLPLLEDRQSPAQRRQIPLFQVEVDTAALFAEAGPLYDIALRLPDGQVDLGRLTAGHRQRARTFLRTHLAQCPFPPSVVLEKQRRWRLLYLLREPLWDSPGARRLLGDASEAVARFLHGGTEYPSAFAIPLPIDAGPELGAPSHLVWARPDRLFDPARTLSRARELVGGLAPTGPAVGRLPRAMRLRTLPEGWGLEDLEIPDDVRQILAAKGEVKGQLVLDRLPQVIHALAVRGHGWQDVELLLRDPRYGLAGAAHFESATRLGLRRRFFAGLRSVSPAYPPRLPHGIRRITELPTENPAAMRRYIVRCGPLRASFDLEVSYDVLASQCLFRKALGRRMGGIPYPITSEVWKGAIAIGLRDPRIFRRAKSDSTDGLSLARRIEQFASQSSAWNPHGETPESLRWPLIRDGSVVFPLAFLRRALATVIHGEPPSRGQVCEAIRGLGGGNHGPMRFGGRVLRVWTVPLPVRRVVKTTATESA